MHCVLHCTMHFATVKLCLCVDSGAGTGEAAWVRYPIALVLHAILDMSDDSCLSTTAIYYNVVVGIVRSSQLSSSLRAHSTGHPSSKIPSSLLQLSRAVRRSWP